MTANEKVARANRWRIKTGPFGTDESAGWNGSFIVPLEGELWQVRIGDGLGWRHLSITNHQKRQVPSWAIMCRVRDLFFGDEDWVVQFHPPKSEYVNDHPFVLHLWNPLSQALPVPYPCMV